MTALLPDSMTEEDALTCEDPITQVIARMSVSPIYSNLADWFNAEMKRPGANADHILIGMAAFMVQMHASFAAYFLEAEHAEAVLGQFQAVVDRTYRLHFIDSANHVSTETKGNADG